MAHNDRSKSKQKKLPLPNSGSLSPRHLRNVTVRRNRSTTQSQPTEEEEIDAQLEAMGLDTSDLESLDEKKNMLKALKNSTTEGSLQNESVLSETDPFETSSFETACGSSNASNIDEEITVKDEQKELVYSRKQRLQKIEEEIFEHMRNWTRADQEDYEKLMSNKVFTFESYSDDDEDLTFERKKRVDENSFTWYYTKESGLTKMQHHEKVANKMEKLSLMAMQKDVDSELQEKDDTNWDWGLQDAVNVPYRKVVEFNKRQELLNKLEGTSTSSNWIGGIGAMGSKIINKFSGRDPKKPSFPSHPDALDSNDDDDDDIFQESNHNTFLDGKNKAGRGRGAKSAKRGAKSYAGTPSKPQTSGTVRKQATTVRSTKDESKKHASSDPQATLDVDADKEQQIELKKCPTCGVTIPENVLESTHREKCSQKSKNLGLNKEDVMKQLVEDWESDDDDTILNADITRGVKRGPETEGN
ncbi:U3 small nucleolar ribonucleoprotein protein MPP10-like isoform X2 [Neocloeon triangulifer]|uniref:U3 small nucleolar ribonucleoprotein protein MPP10-like isoform X2 n=1 Tax=Neocloeon triangulifer TaxID=2078957 RepID=UPI00286F2AD2|nr:U3 small nucleolar ribonucleoprotein protein MPP10-like isoform X2 [Neocloeon triangulifer]